MRAIVWFTIAVMLAAGGLTMWVAPATTTAERLAAVLAPLPLWFLSFACLFMAGAEAASSE